MKLTRKLQNLFQKEGGVAAISGTTETLNNAGIPPYQYVKQRYSDRITVGDAVLSPDEHVFRLNDTFDPDQTGSGHQPKGRDFYASIYSNYTVIGCRYRVRFIANSTAHTWVGCLINTDTAIGTNFDTVSEYREAEGPYCKQKFLRHTNENVESEVLTISGYVPMDKFLLPTTGSFSDQFTAGVGTSPATPVRLHIWCDDEDGSVPSANAVICHVDLWYDVVYHGVAAATSS